MADVETVRPKGGPVFPPSAGRLRRWARRMLGRITLEKISTIMGMSGLAFLAIVAAVSAWNERRTLFHEAEDHAANSALFLADHAQRLFEVADIALRSTMLATRALDWSTIEHSETVWASLRQTNALMPYVGDIWLNDATGRLRMTTFAFPTPTSNVADRAIFAAVRQSDHLAIGERIVGKLTHQPTFLVARPILDMDGTFRGMVSATIDLSYFTDYWRDLELPNQERLAVVHGGTGDVLVATGRSPDTPAMGNVAAFERAVADAPDAGKFIPGSDFQTFYHRIGDLPLYLTVTFSRADVLSAWHRWLQRIAPIAAALALGLFTIMMLGRRQGRREAQAARQIAIARADLQQVNRHLEDRVAARTADLQDSNEQIQRYAYIISHDLRAPLVNIAGFTAELQDLRPALFGGGAASGETMRDFDEAIGFIRTSADKMDRLIGAILRLSRDGRRHFRPEPIDLTALLRSIADGVAHQTHKAGATIAIAPLPPLVSDRVAVEQIFSNLLDNAVKYLRPGIDGHVRVSGERSDTCTKVTIEDNGRGIDEKDHERIFELFRRAGAQDRPGEGIGLAHVRALVRRLGGSIRVDSGLDRGAVFTVALPDMDDPGLASVTA